MTTGTDKNKDKNLLLCNKHQEAGAKFVSFAGWKMPMQYTGIVDEHMAVRERVGVFDVSHMGQVRFTGPKALSQVDRLITNDLTAIKDGQALYTVMLLPNGGIVDDLIVYRFSPEHIFICINAACRDKDVAHMRAFAESPGCVFEDVSDHYDQLAVQGPRAEAVLAGLIGEEVRNIAFYHFAEMEFSGTRCIVARTGYTGEDGFELYIPKDKVLRVFDDLMNVGEPEGVQLCGLGARDTLRLEARLLLYGSDMDETTTPYEAGLGWVVKLGTEDFIGREALLEQKKTGISRRLQGFLLEERGILRPHYPIYYNDEQVGELTSGTFAPYLKKSIGLGYVKVPHGRHKTLEIAIRKRRLKVSVTRKPFYKR